jgi:hypothetical protein
MSQNILNNLFSDEKKINILRSVNNSVETSFSNNVAYDIEKELI